MKKIALLTAITLMMNSFIFADTGFLRDSSICYEWDSTFNSWQLSRQYISSYDADGNEIGFVFRYWSGSVWVNKAQSIYSYDGNKKLITAINQGWNYSLSTWENFWQGTYTYDANGNRISEVSQFWNGTSWNNLSSQSIYTYDAAGHQTSELQQSWNGNAWNNSVLLTYTYDANGNKINFVVQNWNGAAWENQSRSDYTYDANGNLISRVSQSWSGTTWINSSQEIYSYDSDDNMTGILAQIWNGILWENSSQSLYTHDTNGNQTSELRQTWNGIIWINGQKDMGDSCYYTYFKVTGIEQLPMNRYADVQISPNPFSSSAVLRITNADELRVANLEFRMYDVLGREVFSSHISHSTFHISPELPIGIYFYQITDEKKTIARGKIVKQ